MYTCMNHNYTLCRYVSDFLHFVHPKSAPPQCYLMIFFFCTCWVSHRAKTPSPSGANLCQGKFGSLHWAHWLRDMVAQIPPRCFLSERGACSRGFWSGLKGIWLMTQFMFPDPRFFFWKTHVFSCLFLKTASLLEMTQEKHDRIPDVAFLGNVEFAEVFWWSPWAWRLVPGWRLLKPCLVGGFQQIFDFNFGEMIQFDYKNHGISKQVVWRSQTPTIRIQTPL